MRLQSLLKSAAALKLLLVLLSGLFASYATAAAPGMVTLSGHVPAAVAQLSPLSHLASTNVLRLAIGLPSRNPAALNTLVQQVYDRASTNYQHYLTPEQFASQFGATEADYQAVTAFAQANGLTITATHPNRLILDVSGAATDIEKAFQIQLQVYNHPKEARTFYAPTTEPVVSAALPILHISGLDNYSLPHPKMTSLSKNAHVGASPMTGSGPSGNYLGSDFRTAYVPGTSLTGAGQNVGLLQFDGFYPSDIAAYKTLIGMGGGPNLVTVPVDGGVVTPGSGNVEVCLDIEMVLAMAPGVSNIYVYEAPNGSAPWVDILSQMANDNLAKQLSCSWGGGAPDPSSELVFQQMAVQGQSFYNAVGDYDAFVAPSNSVVFPSDSPNITQVGGTTLTTGAGASYTTETVWNWGYNANAGAYVGTGGGISPNYTIPSWQTNISMVNNQGSTTMRNMPDVAMTADNVWVTADNGSSGSVGGTSCAAPLWAAFTALVNQQAANFSQPVVGFLAPKVYALANTPKYSSCFHDITTGNNTSDLSPTNFYAVPGYDLCTGLGTPNGNNLIDFLAAPVFPGGTNTTGPANDNFAHAMPISGLSGTLTSSNTGATMEPGEPNYINTDDYAGVDNSVWYAWTAPSNGVVAFDTFGSDFDTVLAVYVPIPGIDYLVAANDDYIPLIVPQSRVTFTAVAGTTYYISVNGNSYPAPGFSDSGNFVLNWKETVPTISSGMFRFTSATYVVSDRESTPPTDPALHLSLLGARVTVTRINGSSGRVIVPYSVNGDAGQTAATSSGTVTFDDYQMSADLPVIPITQFVGDTNGSASGTISVTLGAPVLDPLESTDLIPPTADPALDATTVKVASSQLFAFERATFRVARGGQKTVNIYARPSGIPPQNMAYTVQYAIDHNTGYKTQGPQYNNFPLQAGSDYATPDMDFIDNSGGTLTWANNASYQPIPVTILDTTNVAFNEDLQLGLYNAILTTNGNPNQPLGQVYQSTLTILPSIQPAGAVDRTWNVEGSSASIPPNLTYPGTQGGVADNANGNGGTVYAAIEQTDGKLILGGSFNIYDSNPYNRLVRVKNDGYPDPTFMASPNSGANDTIMALALQPDGKVIIGGSFTSFNGVNRYHVARLNTDGSVDTTFNPGLGANDKVRAIALQSDGKIFIGGEFTSYNRTTCNYLARLNTDGSLDTAFTPGNLINGPVYSLAVPPFAPISISGSANGGQAENDNPVNLGSSTSGTLTVDYDMQSVPDDMRVFYGATNGVLIYDTGMVSGTNHLVIPFGPTNGVTTNLITIVMDQGGGQSGTFWSYTAAITTSGTTQVYAGGAFTAVGGVICGGVARFNGDGTLDTTFNPGIGTYNPITRNTDPVKALALQSDGKLLAGGSFAYVEMTGINGITRFNRDGTVDTMFGTTGATNGTYNPQTGAVDTVNTITLQPDGEILIGGDFTTINQTRRVGIARLFSDGSVDTGFMDTAYNQFAGVVNHYHNPDAVNLNDYPEGNHRNAINAIAVEPNTTNVIVGGSFLVVGGGSFGHSGKYFGGTGIIDNGRMDVHPRSNVARLIGGTTTGPGNIAFSYNTYTVGKSDKTLYVSLTRTNGNLGIIGAAFNASPGPAGQPGIAQNPMDFTFNNVEPTWNTYWDNPTPGALGWMYGDGMFGPNYHITLANSLPSRGPGVQLTINNNGNITGNLNASFSLTQPCFTNFLLGGELIPLGAALGAQQSSLLTIIDPNFKAGTFSFSAAAYTVNESSNVVTIMVTRTNGTHGAVQVSYATFNGTAKSPTNYTSVAGTLSFADGDTSKTFTVPIIPSTSSSQSDRTVNLALFGITGGGQPGLTNAVLTIVNNVYGAGHIAFAFATNSVNENAGSASIVLNRIGASSGTMDVTAITSDGTAVKGVNYVGITNIVHWDANDALPKTINIPVIRDYVYTPNLTVNIRLTNGMAGSRANAFVLGLSTLTNSTLVISNVDFPGTVQFSAGAYSVKKYGGSALIPVVRTGGSAGTVTVGYSTLDGSATNGVDYTHTSGTLTFNAGEVFRYFNVPILTGSTNGLVSLNLILSNTAPASALGSPTNAVLNIIDTTTVNETPGAPDVTYSSLVGFNDAVYALALQTNNQLIAGGDFTMANGVPRQHIARLNADGTLDASFSLPSSTMGADASVRAVAIQTDGRILIGGYFTNYNSVVMNGIARLNYDGSLDSQFNPGSGSDNPVYALAETFVNGDRKVLVAGGFSQLNGEVANGVGRLNDDGTPDTSFNAGGLGANGTVYALAVQSDGRILIGGDFTAVNGINLNHIARLNVDGSVDVSFTNATAGDSVRAITIQMDGRILVGGLFTSMNGNTNFNHIARLNSADGSVDSTFTPTNGPGANDAVLSIALQTDNRIILGGEFTQASGVTRNRITRLNPNGTVDPTINFGAGADGFVAAVVVQESTIAGYPTIVPDEKLIIGGGFTHYYGDSYQRLTRIYGGSISGSGAFEFSSPTYSVNENGINAVITVNRTGGTSGTNSDGSGNVSVSFATSDGTAVNGVNYTGVTNSLSFPAGEVLQTVVIPVMDDQVVTSNLTVNMALTPVAPADYGDQPTAVLTIINTDSAISFSAPTYLATKYGTNVPNGSTPIYVNRNGATYGTSTVVFNTTTNGTATSGVDYLPQTNVLVTFEPGDTVHTVMIPVINGYPDGDQTVRLQLTNATGSTLYNPSNATLTILDRTLAKGFLLFSATNYVVSEGGGAGYSTAYVTVLRTNGSSGIVSVNYFTMDGTAMAGGKYVNTSGLLTFGDGEMSKTITVQVYNTATVESPEYFSVLLTNATGGATLISPTAATVTIYNTNTGIAFTTATNTFIETAGYANINVLRYNNTNGTVTVTYSTTNGTAVAGTNYQAASGTLTFGPGASQASIQIPLIYDTNATGPLQFTVGLSNPSSSAQIGTPGLTTVILQDADAALSLTTNNSTVLKNAGSAVVTVTCSNPNAEPVSVNYATADGTGVAGIDYTATSGTLTFSNGIATNTFSVPVINNGAVAGNHWFSVSLSNPTGVGRLVSPTTQTNTIIDSNSGLYLSSATYRVAKTDGGALITVYRSDYTNTVSTVNFVATNGTAVNGLNFVATNGTLVFSNGVTASSFTIPVINTTIIQPDLTVLLQLSNPTNGILLAPTAATLTIHDNSGSYVIPAGSQIVTNFTSPSDYTNGIIGTNDTVQVLFAFRDAGGTNVNNLIATLLATNGVTPVGYVKTNYGPLVYSGHSVSRPFTFTVHGTNHQQVAATFLLQDTNSLGLTNIGTGVFGFTLGSWTSIFSNSAVIIINDTNAASPYPSAINVSGVGGSLIKATVTLNKLTHTYPHDVDALVVSPAQLNTLIMAHVGGGNSVTNLVLTFDSTSTNVLSATGRIASGTNQPTQNYPVKNFP